MARPVKYKTVEEVEEKIEEYFNNGAFIQNADGSVKYCPTMAGLAFALDLSRQGLLEYSRKDEFSDTIKKARQKVEIHLEQSLYGQTVTGIIFNLKNNFGWKDKQEVDNTSSDGSMSPVTFNFNPVSNDS